MLVVLSPCVGCPAKYQGTFPLFLCCEMIMSLLFLCYIVVVVGDDVLSLWCVADVYLLVVATCVGCC